MNQEDAQIVSQMDSIVKIARDTITPFGTTKVKGVIRAPNQQIHIFKPASNKIPVVL